MSAIDISKPFQPLGITILSVSDTRNLESDTSGARLAERASEAGHEVIDRKVVRDEVSAIRKAVRDWASNDRVNVILTTGGTGLSGRDVTPEAVRPLFDKEIDGFAAVFHRVSFESVGLSTLLSRACAGIIGNTYLFCLPGSRGAVTDAWDQVLGALLDNRHGPCNFSEMLPRLLEP